MSSLAQEFLTFCPQEKVEEAKVARKKVQVALATIEKKKKEFKELYKQEVLKPQNRKFLEAKAKVGEVLKGFHENLQKKNKNIKEFWKTHKKETKQVFGFGYTQAAKYVSVHNNKEKIEKIFQSCLESLPHKVDRLVEAVTEFANNDSPTAEEVKSFLNKKQEKAKEKQQKNQAKRKRRIQELETKVDDLEKELQQQRKRRKTRAQKKLDFFLNWFAEKEPNFVLPIFPESDEEEEEEKNN